MVRFGFDSRRKRPSPLTKIINWFKDTFGDMWEKVTFWKDKDPKEDKKSEEDRIGAEAYKYKKMAGLAEEFEGKDKGKKDKKNKQDLELAQKDFKSLSDLLTNNGITEPLNIKVNEDDLTKDNVSAENQKDLQSIQSLMEKDEFANARVLLTKGCELSDLAFLARHNGDGNDDGINVEFGKDGFEMSYDAQGIWDSFNLEGEALGALLAGVGLGVGAATFSFTGPILITLATVAGLGGAFGANKIEEFLKFGGESFDYSDLDPEKLKKTIGNMKEKVGKLNLEIKKVTQNLEGTMSSLSDSDKAELKKRLEEISGNSGFKELIEDLPQFWGDYPLTKEDVEAFLALEKEGEFDSNAFFDAFHEETIDKGDTYIDSQGNEQTATEDIEGFEVNGTGEWWGNLTFGIGAEDLKFVDVEGFFAWLRDKHQNKTEEE